MINVLLPSMGNSGFFKDAYFPKLLTEFTGKTMLELVIDNYRDLRDKKYIFVLAEDDCRRFHIDSSIKLLEPSGKVIRLGKMTAGALCTCLMAVEFINNDEPLIIANSDQIIDVDYQAVLDYFNRIDAEAGLITFPNIHPRWSYAKTDNDCVIEVAEKKPFTNNAIAGFYYFKHGSDFVQAAENAIVKKNHLDGKYYISSSVNEIILMGKKVGFYDIKMKEYHSFYSPAKIKEFEEEYYKNEKV